MPCRCSACFTLREAMLEITGKDYGLAAAPGHAPPHLRPVESGSSSMTELDPAEFRRLQERARNRVRQPWETAA